MRKWIQYQKERFPFIFYVPFSFLFTLSTMRYGVRRGGGKTEHVVGMFFYLWFLIFSFFQLFRIADEHKDYEKDCMEHPDRPVQRKLITLHELRNAGVVLLLIQFLLTICFYRHVLAVYILLYLYFMLMIKEFYIPDYLEHHSFIYGALHQVILLLLDLFIIFTTQCTNQLTWKSVYVIYGLSRYLCFFSIYVLKEKKKTSENKCFWWLQKLAYLLTAVYLTATCFCSRI